MDAQTLLLKNALISITIAAPLYLSPYLMAADVDNCVLCHKYSGLGRIDESGKKHLYYVNEKLYQQSVHGKIRCNECHVDIKKYPHSNPKKVDCATVCHLLDPSTDRKFSHANTIEKYELSVHGTRDSQGKIKEFADDLPTCTYCHKNRIHQPISGLANEERGIAQEILDRCLGCHPEEQWTKAFYSHFTHRLHQRRSSRTMVELCSSCHGDEEKMSRHGLKATGTFHDTFHWQAIKYGDPNAPNCITCHAPVGYFSHQIMPKTDSLSAIHEDNLVRTCSNPGGLQTCHPDATPAFAQGKIHPTGFKMGIFEHKMIGLERVRKIERGEMKPFQSVRAKPVKEKMGKVEYYQQMFLQFIKYFYMFLIGGLISFMILHQTLDYFATRREMRKAGTH